MTKNNDSPLLGEFALFGRKTRTRDLRRLGTEPAHSAAVRDTGVQATDTGVQTSDRSHIETNTTGAGNALHGAGECNGTQGSRYKEGLTHLLGFSITCIDLIHRTGDTVHHSGDGVRSGG